MKPQRGPSVRAAPHYISGSANPSGYVYVETTAKNYRKGDIPSKIKYYFLDPSFYPKKSFTIEI